MEEKRKARALLGFMEETDARNFRKTMSVFDGRSEEEFLAIWKKARLTVDALPDPSLDAEVLDIDKRFTEQLSTVAKEPLFSEVVQKMKWSFKLVEIDKLVCFQKFVFTDHSESMAKDYDLANTSKLIEFCFTEKPLRRHHVVLSGPQEFTVLAPSHDLRVLGSAQMQDPTTKRSIYGFTIGWGLPFVQVVKFKDRYFLKNGFHRVYGLRKNGLKHVACILLEGDKIADTGMGNPGFFGEALVMSPKPPTFANYFSDEISPSLELRSMTKVVRVKTDESLLPVILPEVATADHETTVASAAVGSKPSKRPQFDEFKIIKEDWDTYKLSDGAIIRLRMILQKVKIQQTSGLSQPIVSIQPSGLMMAVYPPPRLKGPPSTRAYSLEELSASIVERNLEHQTILNTVNEYETAGGLRILFQITTVTVGRTNKYDAEGDPMYVANVESSFQIAQNANLNQN